MTGCFLDERRLRLGPWNAFERDVARLLWHSGFQDVRIIGGSGDFGGDVLGAKNGKVWVVQCKHSTTGYPPATAVEEVVTAGSHYSADRLLVATSRPTGPSFQAQIDRHSRLGITIERLDPLALLEMAERVPEYSPTRRELRPYQRQATDMLRETLVDTGKGQVVLATGLGKTVVMAETVAELLRDGLIPHDRVLVLADKKELVDQLIQGFWHQLPKWVHTHRLTGAETPTYWDGITFATVQSVLGRAAELPEFGLVLVDEAHHIGSPTFLETINQLKPPMLAGVTATPWRGDRFDLDELLGPAVMRMGISDGLKHGYLCEVDYRLMADDLDWKFVQQHSSHDYSLTQLNSKLIIPTRDEEAARLIKNVFDKEDRRAGIVFSRTIQHAEEFAGMLRLLGLRARAISSELAARDRDKLMTAFRAGALDIVVTVDLFNEGVDVPDVDLLAFMRVTHSRRIFVQQVGRGLRTSDGKENVIVLDFVTDLRRIAEVVELEKAVRDQDIERLPLGGQIIQFSDEATGSFMYEWMKDQADLMIREDDPDLLLPEFNYPGTPTPGSVQ